MIFGYYSPNVMGLLTWHMGAQVNHVFMLKDGNPSVRQHWMQNLKDRQFQHTEPQYMKPQGNVSQTSLTQNFLNLLFLFSLQHEHGAKEFELKKKNSLRVTLPIICRPGTVYNCKSIWKD